MLTFIELKLKNPNNKAYQVAYYILRGSNFILIDSGFLLLWFEIYSSTEVLLLLNKKIKNSE